MQDWQYWGSDKDGSWSGMIWNSERLSRSRRHARQELHDSRPQADGLDLAIDRQRHRSSPGSSIGKGCASSRCIGYPRQARVYDAYSPLGRAIYFKHIKSGLLDKGVDALWMDGTEVEVSSAMWNAQDNHP